jgi:putative transposase
MELEWIKTVSAVLMPVNCLDPRSTTGPCRCGPQRCGLWPESIDAFYLEHPCSGSRRMVDDLARVGIPIRYDRLRNLVRRMVLRTIYQKPRTTVPGDPSGRFPCLVDLDMVTAVDQVWATDITCIPLRHGFLYLVAIVDLFSGTYSAGGSPTALTWSSVWTPWRCLWKRGDGQRSSIQIRAASSPHPLTSSTFVVKLQVEEIKINWSGRKRCYDNILVERLWRTVLDVAEGF